MPTPDTVCDDFVLMSTRADILWTYDGRGRMLRTRSPDSQPAPRLFVGRALAGHFIRFGEGVPDAVARELTAIVERQPPVSGLPVPPSLRAELREILEWQAPVAEEGGGPAYRFPEVIAQPGGVVEVTEANLAVVRDTFPWLYENLAAWAPCFAVVRDGMAVSACSSARIGREALEASLFTIPDARGRGYAVAVTAAWGASVRSSGRIPLYSTAWENVASRGVARRAGLVMFGADAHWT